ncbi:PH domain-containing protein [Actinokineospora soli]|uniref:PH domain-containing protein n=1 Tax=Actinokineospora soli TaxID=1048753 RepID=A0ABW2TY81_9PSEU
MLLLLLALFGTLARPRLSADHEGVTVRGPLSTRRWRWAEVNVRLVRTRRFGRETAAVELDADNADPPALVLLGRLDLGADPVDVADALVRLRT